MRAYEIRFECILQMEFSWYCSTWMNIICIYVMQLIHCRFDRCFHCFWTARFSALYNKLNASFQSITSFHRHLLFLPSLFPSTSKQLGKKFLQWNTAMTVDTAISMNFTVISLFSDDGIIRWVFTIFFHAKSVENAMKDCMTTFGTEHDQWKKGIETSNWITQINKFDMKLKSKWAISNAMTKYYSASLVFTILYAHLLHRSINSLLLAEENSRNGNIYFDTCIKFHISEMLCVLFEFL